MLIKEEKGDFVPPPDTRPHMRVIISTKLLDKIYYLVVFFAIQVIQAHPDTSEEISLDAVTIKDFERNRPVDYRLDFIIEEGSYFIVSPKDVIKAVPRSFDDHIRWLMENYEFEQALDEINKAPPNTAKIYTHQVN